MTIINRVGKPSGKRIVKDEEYYNGRILITQFQHTQKKSDYVTKIQRSSLLYKSLPAGGSALTIPALHRQSLLPTADPSYPVLQTQCLALLTGP